MCFQDVHEHSDGSLNMEMEGGGRRGQPDENRQREGQ